MANTVGEFTGPGGFAYKSESPNFGAPQETAARWAAGSLLNVDSSGDALLARQSGASGDARRAHGYALSSGTDKTTRVTLLRQGVIDHPSDLTAGSTYYLTGDGDVTATRPTTAGELRQVVGFAIATDSLVIDIESDPDRAT